MEVKIGILVKFWVEKVPGITSDDEIASCYYPRQESNLQSPDPESDALSIRPRGQYLTRRAASPVWLGSRLGRRAASVRFSFSILLTHTKPTCVPPLVPFSAPHLTTNRIPKLRSERRSQRHAHATLTHGTLHSSQRALHIKNLLSRCCYTHSAPKGGFSGRAKNIK